MRSVSVVMPTFNSIRTIEACLKSVRGQDYDGDVEIVVADGGSSDGTLAVLEKYGCVVVEDRSGDPERAKAVGLRQAKGELVLFLASDNVLADKSWLTKMAESLEKEPKVVASYPWRYAVREKDKSLNRYFALIGANDPVAWFMGRADRQAWGSKQWCLAGKAVDKGDYWLVEFDKNNMPTLGDNGVLVWKNKLMRAQVDEEHFSHIDVFYDLVVNGLNQFVVVKNSIIHDTGESFFKSLKKRYRYMTELYLEKRKVRRYKWVRGFGDKLRLGLYVLYSLTLMGPVLESLWGFMSKPDWAWFWHPAVSFCMMLIYGKAVIHSRLRILTNYRV